uniref:Uncharacterized protein n=1 Tax=Panagrolaimus sp. JU765 TaxID=591449 RepID=A0AC34RDS5_9BILA
MKFLGKDNKYIDGSTAKVLYFEIYDDKIFVNNEGENITTIFKPLNIGNQKLAIPFKLTGKNITNFLEFQFEVGTIGFDEATNPKNVKSQAAGFVNSYQFYLIIGGVILVVAAAVGGGLAWYYCRKKKAIKNQAVTPIQIKVEPRTETKTETKTTKEEEKKPKRKKKDDKQESSRSSARKYFSRKNIKYAQASDDWDGDLVVNKPKQDKNEPAAAAPKISKVEVENVKTDLTSAKIVVPAESSKGASASAAGTSNAGRKVSQELPLVTAVDEPENKKEEVVKTTQTDNK